MGQLEGLNILLYSGYTPRASALVERVERACEGESEVHLVETLSTIEVEDKSESGKTVIILDLPNIKQPAVQTIRAVRQQDDTRKILAIHIYTTKLLVEPLLKAGIHGYLPYEPSADEISQAMQSVLDNQTYLPDHIAG